MLICLGLATRCKRSVKGRFVALRLDSSASRGLLMASSLVLARWLSEVHRFSQVHRFSGLHWF